MLWTNDDLSNLDSALTARDMNADARIVLRLYDETLAKQVSGAFEIPTICKPSAEFSDRRWEGRQLAGLEVGANGMGYGGDGVVAALLQGAEDAHEDGLGFGSVLAAVGVAVLPSDHRRADLTLGVVVVERNFGMIEEREQLSGMTPQSLHQAARVALFPRLSQQFVQPYVQPPSTRCERLRGEFFPPLAQADRVADQPLQLFGERRPMAWPSSKARRRRPPDPAKRSARLARPSTADRERSARMPDPGCPYPSLPWQYCNQAVVRLQDQLNSAESLQKNRQNKLPNFYSFLGWSS